MSGALQRIAIVGAGGFARETLWVIREMNRVQPRFDFIGFVVSDRAHVAPQDGADCVIRDFDWLEAHQRRIDAVALGIGTPALRRRLAAEIETRAPGLVWPVLIHPEVSIDHASLSVGRGVFIGAGVTATVNIRLAEFAFVNLACTIGHEASIGACSGLNPSVNVSGGVRIGEQVLVGTGAQILQNLNIGDRATVGAGAVVTADVTSGTTVVGIPAKPLKHA